MKTDIEIAQETKMLPITTVASQYGITEDDLELYGKYKAKISNELWQGDQGQTGWKNSFW